MTTPWPLAILSVLCIGYADAKAIEAQGRRNRLGVGRSGADRRDFVWTGLNWNWIEKKN
jgi:hypothetical protein